MSKVDSDIAQTLAAEQAALISAWYSEDTASEVAADLGVTAKDIERAWRYLKRDGKLPDTPRRPGAASSGHLDGRLRIDAIGGGDPLLERLQRAHPEGPRADLVNTRKRKRGHDKAR